jgi:hypothetical protein
MQPRVAEREAFQHIVIEYLNETTRHRSPCLRALPRARSAARRFCRTALASVMRGCTAIVGSHGGPSDGLRPKPI